MPLSDTPPEIERMQSEIVMRMTPEERVRRMLEFSEAMHATLRNGIRARHPEFSPEQIIVEFERMTLPPALFAEIHNRPDDT